MTATQSGDATRHVVSRHSQAKPQPEAPVRTAYITLGSPWENGYVESFNARLRDELLNGEMFYTLREVQVVIESWRRHYNRVRPHASLGYRAPSPEVVVPALAARPARQPAGCGQSGVFYQALSGIHWSRH